MFESLLEPKEFRWPKTGDQLIRLAAHWETGAELVQDTFSRTTFLWGGYMQAGARLVESARELRADRHAIVYPILFCYRHGLEMAMKWMLTTYGRFAVVEEYDKDHQLDKLWRSTRKLIVECGGGIDPEGAVDAVEAIVMEFHKLDRTSFSFRYAITKKGDAVELPNFAIDLENVRDVMEGVDGFFKGLDGMLDHNTSSGYYDGP